MSYAYFNDQLTQKDSLAVKVADYGFARGVSIFEFARVYGGVPFHMDDHLDRFDRGAAAFGIACPATRAQIHARVADIIARNRFAHSGIKLYLTAGICAHPGGGFASDADFSPNLYILEEEFRPQHPDAPKGLDVYRRGLAVKTVPFARQTFACKTINYAPGFLAARQAAQDGYDEILFTHPDGYVTETTTANIFFMIGDTLCTPAQGMLDGVTRKVLLQEIAPAAGVAVRVCDLALRDARKASGAFITGSYAEMMPLRKLDEQLFAQTTDHPVYRKLRESFSAYIRDYKPAAAA